MSDIPEDLLPDEPKRIGTSYENGDVIGDGVYPRNPGHADQEPGVCDTCEEHKGNVYLGVHVDSGDLRRICILCRIRYATSVSDPE